MEGARAGGFAAAVLEHVRRAHHFRSEGILDRFEPACLVVEVAEVIVHKADEPNLLADLLDAEALASEDGASRLWNARTLTALEYVRFLRPRRAWPRSLPHESLRGQDSLSSKRTKLVHEFEELIATNRPQNVGRYHAFGAWSTPSCSFLSMQC